MAILMLHVMWNLQWILKSIPKMIIISILALFIGVSIFILNHSFPEYIKKYSETELVELRLNEFAQLFKYSSNSQKSTFLKEDEGTNLGQVQCHTLSFKGCIELVKNNRNEILNNKNSKLLLSTQNNLIDYLKLIAYLTFCLTLIWAYINPESLLRKNGAKLFRFFSNNVQYYNETIKLNELKQFSLEEIKALNTSVWLYRDTAFFKVIISVPNGNNGIEPLYDENGKEKDGFRVRKSDDVIGYISTKDFKKIPKNLIRDVRVGLDSFIPGMTAEDIKKI